MGIATHSELKDSRRLKSPSRFPVRTEVAEFPTYRRFFMIQELDSVVLTIDIPEQNLSQGDIGTVVLVHQGGVGYEVEFVTLTGKTVAIISLFSSQVRLIGDREIAHARMLA